MRMLGNIPLVN